MITGEVGDDDATVVMREQCGRESRLSRPGAV
jgi:hypothetical protein